MATQSQRSTRFRWLSSRTTDYNRSTLFSRYRCEIGKIVCRARTVTPTALGRTERGGTQSIQTLDSDCVHLKHSADVNAGAITLRWQPRWQRHAPSLRERSRVENGQQACWRLHEQSQPTHLLPTTTTVPPEEQMQLPNGIDATHTNGSRATISNVLRLEMRGHMIRPSPTELLRSHGLSPSQLW